MNTSVQDENLLQSLRIRQSSTVASLVVLLYEYFASSRQEFRYIWRKPFKLNQFVYLFSRYLAITVQCVNTGLTLGPYSRLSIDEGTCRKWILFQALGAYVLTGTLHLILMLIVYALHFKGIKIGIFLAILFLYQAVMQALVTPKAIIKIGYDPICDTKDVPLDTMVLLGISTIVTYISLVALTIAKKDLMKLGVPIVKRVIRDGASTIILLTSAFIAMISYMWIRRVCQGHFVFGWTSTLASIACCRIILNMESLNISEPDPEHFTVDFNSADNLQLRQLEWERREQAGLEDAASA